MKFLTNFINKIRSIYVTHSERLSEISQTRDISTPESRDMKQEKLIMESFHCPYCGSTQFVKRGFRQKKRERVQLYLCSSCHKTFTPHQTKGKHYPLSVMLDAISIYNLGYSLEQTCKIINERQQKSRLSNAAFSTELRTSANRLDPSQNSINEETKLVNKEHRDVDQRGVEPLQPDLTDPAPHRRWPTQNSFYSFALQPSTLSNWLEETKELCRFSRMREYALKKFAPKDMVISATLAHRQLYRYRFHQAKCSLMIQEEYQHRKFTPLQEFLEMVPVECPHQYFQRPDAEIASGISGSSDDGTSDQKIRTNSGAVFRASQSPLFFSKTQMIIRAKQNYANKLATFVLQSVKERKQRHEALQKFMLANDSVTVATEVPVYITKDDIEHMKTQLGFQIYNNSKVKMQKSKVQVKSQNPENPDPSSAPDFVRDLSAKSLPKTPSPIDGVEIADISSLPKLITGHIDILQIRNGQIHILDYKPRAEKERPIEQLTLYAMALSRLTGLRLFEFKCAWFDERDYFEFYPLHVLHKPRKTSRRRKVYTMEGIYSVNKNKDKILEVRPTL